MKRIAAGPTGPRRFLYRERAGIRMAKRDYYQVLDVARTATEAEIKKAYRRLAMKFHPGPQSQRSRGRGAVQGGQGGLRSPDRRAEARRLRPVRPRRRRAASRGGRRGFDPRRRLQRHLRRRVRRHLRRRSRRGRSQVFRGADLRYELELDLEQAVFGDTANVEFTTLAECERVQGHRARPRARSPSTCETCRGAGQVRMQQGFFAVQQTCPRCQGRGQVITDPCRDCRGQGRVRKQKTLAVKVPAGVDNGDRIRLTRRRRGRAQRRARRRSLRRDPRPRAHDLRARRQPPVLRGPDELRDRHARRHRSRCRRSTATSRSRFRRRHSRGACSACARRASSPCAAAPTGDLFCRVVVETPVNLTREQKELLQELRGLAQERCQAASSARGFVARRREALLFQPRGVTDAGASLCSVPRGGWGAPSCP